MRRPRARTRSQTAGAGHPAAEPNAPSSGQPPKPTNAGTIWLMATLFGVLALMLAEYLVYPLSGIGGRGLRYLLFLPLILALFFMAGARFAQHVFSLNSNNSGFQYLMAKVFGSSLPSLVVSEGTIQVEQMGQENLVHSIGGPGYLVVMPGNAALLEGLDGSVRVVGAGHHYIGPLESVKEAFSLEERFDQIEKSTATTRDGIAITARDIRFRYRVYAGPDTSGFGRTPENPYPFSEEGVINLVYNRTMGAHGLGDWHSGVKGTVEGFIQDYIRTHTANHLIAPDPGSEDPRGEIYRQINSDAGKKRFREKGVELLWVDIGHLEPPEKAADQLTDHWQARWSGSARVTRAYGEAERARDAELGRGEATAEMLMALLNGLQSGGGRMDELSEGYGDNLARLAQIIDVMKGR